MANREPVMYGLPFLEQHQATFHLIKSGAKKIETRAGSEEYLKIKVGDQIRFSCGIENCIRTVKHVDHFKSLVELLNRYNFATIHPGITSRDELMRQYMGFPGYTERINRYGILVFELEEL